MDDRDRGIYNKYSVHRRDRKPAKGKRYFVVRMDEGRKPWDTEALRAYAIHCAAEFPELAEDLLNMVAGKPACVRSSPRRFGGRAYVAGTDTPIMVIKMVHDSGVSNETIKESFQLSDAQLRTALEYADAHPEVMERDAEGHVFVTQDSRKP